MTISTTRFVLAACLVGLVGLTSAASAETRRVNNITTINAVEAEGRFKLEIVAGDVAEATLTGPADQVSRIGIRYRDGSIRFWEKCTVFCGKQDLDVVVRVVSPRVNEIDLAKGVEARADGIAAQALGIDVAMGASLRISGSCDTLSADVVMGGALSAEHLACRSVSVDAAMGGAADIRASAQVSADATMGGAITVHGAPPRIESSGSMGGTITTAD